MLYRAGMALNVPITYFFEHLADGPEFPAEPPVDKSTLTIVRKLQEIANPNTRQCLARLIEELGKAVPKAKSGLR